MAKAKARSRKPSSNGAAKKKTTGKGSAAGQLHVVKAGEQAAYNTAGHATRTRSPEYMKSTKALKAISESLGPKWYFSFKTEPYQDHHGGGLWMKDDDGWFFVRNLVGIEWSGQFCADPSKVDVLRENARRLYSGFPKSFAAMQEFGIDLHELLNTKIATPDDVQRWTDSICNASVPLPQRFHTGAIPKGGGVHNYPTPVIDIDRFRYDDFTLWVTDDEGQPAAVVPVNKRGEKGRDVQVLHATPGTKLDAALQKATREKGMLVAKEGHPLTKRAFKGAGPAPS